MAKILLADDSVLIRKMTTMNLEKIGFSIIQAEDGQQAYELAQKEKPDIILLDAEMPEMDGWETLEALKKNSITAAIPVFMCTGDDSSDYLEKAKQLGASGYFVKPLKIDEAKEKISSILNK